MVRPITSQIFCQFKSPSFSIELLPDDSAQQPIWHIRLVQLITLCQQQNAEFCADENKQDNVTLRPPRSTGTQVLLLL